MQGKKNRQVTVVMYHYVREISRSAFPGIKGLEVRQFRGQLDYLQKFYNHITAEQLLDAVTNNTELPPNAALLTFDDGYSDHYHYVMPILLERKLQGAFFPPAQAILEHKVLDVNKIHFILAAAPSVQVLLDEISAQLDVYRAEFGIPPVEDLYKELAVASPLDKAEVIFIKRLLQVKLPLEVRGLISHHLFQNFVKKTEAEFNKELYMTTAQLKELQQEGMHIGSHGFAHEWLGKLPEKHQHEEVTKGLEFLKLLGVNLQNWTMAYPYGNYNSSLMQILKNAGCQLAFTTASGVADLYQHHPLELPRIDTVNLPFGR